MKWQKRQGNPLDQELIDQFQLTPIQTRLFSLRGINSAKDLSFWFDATEENLADPFLMHDMQKAVDRIFQAIDNGEKITVYGDYDADGITATTIMVETLQILGADVEYFIPDRFKDGYGPSLKRYKEIVDNGTKLIITVDNGITGVEEVAYAKESGVDTIITDHHTFQKEVPDAFAIVHCNYPGQKYPFDDYCGAGVAYTISRALMDGDPMSDMLEIAMIGTIGDMVKVTGEGHIIVKRGLEMLNETQRPGLRALIELAGLKLGQITGTDIGFNIAPRLNAVGRLENAELAVKLLLCEEPDEAKEIAQKIEELNTERKDLTKEVFEACLKQVTDKGWNNRNTLVIFDEDFHEGVLGLVANKIVEKLHKPTIVLTKDENGDLKGSGRSLQGFNIFNALEPLKGNILTQFGGHDFACGLSLKEDKLDALRKAFEESYHPENDLEVKEYDFELPMKDLSPDIMDEINQVGPFGTGNPEPIFSINDAQITHFFKMGQDKSHVKFTVEKDHQKLETVGFNKGFLNQNLLPFISKIFVTLSLNSWKNKTTLQAMIEDLEYAAPKLAVPTSIIDLRQEDYVMGFADKYLLFNENNKDWAMQAFGLPADKIELVDNYQDNNESLVLLDTPSNSKQLIRAFENNYNQLYLRFLINELPVESIPNKEYFANTLKYIYNHPNLRPEDYESVAPYLGLNYQSVLFILRVFFELQFVKYEDGKLKPVQNPQNQPLTNSKYFQATNAQIKFVRQLKNMPSNQLINYAKRFAQ